MLTSALGSVNGKYEGANRTLVVGVERLVMLKYGITDMRMLYENDLRVLSQVR